jgi:hypothetical protein
MILNLGCGFVHLPGAVNVDKQAGCNPDRVVDLEQTPWPFDDECADEVVLRHVLEHLGATTEIFLAIMKELYRVMKSGAVVKIAVPHPRSDAFLNDPTHVRAILPGTLAMFSQRLNREWIARGWPNTPLGLYLGVDFELIDTQMELAPRYGDRLAKLRGNQQQAFQAEMSKALEERCNVAHEIRMTLQKVGPASGRGEA